MPNRTYPVKRRKKTSIFKIKVWKTTYADNKFSLYIRDRDLVCQRCRQYKPLDNSHYWRRDMKGTRFDPDNCVALCRDCHTHWERHQNEEYKEFMLQRLGRDAYDALETRARRSKKMVDAVIEAMKYLNYPVNGI